MRSQLGKIKIHKDLAFLLDLPKTDISSSIVKYLIKPGIYEEIKALTPPFSVYYTCLTYDY